jgi:hypothetical protein
MIKIFLCAYGQKQQWQLYMCETDCPIMHLGSRPRKRCSRRRLKLSNGYPKLISYVETNNFTFQPIIPLRSNSSLECDPKLRKCGSRTTRLHSQIKTMSKNLKWVYKVDFISGNEEFYFSTHNPTSFKLGPGK